MKTLRESLVDYDIAMLRAIAEQHGIFLETNVQKEAADYLALELARPERVQRGLELLGSEEREALDNLIRWGGRVRATFFTRRYGPIRPFGPGRLTRERPWENPAGPAERLWFLGFIFRGFEITETGLTEVVYIPQDLLPLLPAPPAIEEVFPVQEAPEPASTARARPYLLEALFLYLTYLQKEAVKPGSEGALSPPVQKALERLFAKRGTLPPFWSELLLPCVHNLATDMELLTLESGLLKPFADRVRTWLKLRPWERLGKTWQSWLDSTSWNELWVLPSLLCEDTGWRNDPRLARRRIVAFLARCPGGKWLSLESFVAAVKETEPDFQRPDGNYNTWYIRDRATGEYLMGFEHWDRVEGALIPFLITGPLHWFGAVELGLDEGRTAVAFRLTPQGERLLGLAPAPPDEAQDPIIVQQDFSILVPHTASLYDRFQVERFSTWTGSSERHHGYLITRSSLQAAFSRGIKIEMILAFLKRATGNRIPSNVAQALKRWARQYGTLRLRRLLVLETPDEATMNRLKELPQVSKLIRDFLSPTHAVIRDESHAELVKLLREMGYSVEGKTHELEDKGDGLRR